MNREGLETQRGDIHGTLCGELTAATQEWVPISIYMFFI
jgi:hypothetical protein